MEAHNSLFSNLSDGFNKCIIRSRIVRTWNSINVKTGELYSKDMLLLDEQGMCIHAQIPERILDRLEKHFIAGGIVSIRYFNVRPAAASHRPVPNNKKIQFLRNSIVKPQTEDPALPTIPKMFFDFAEEDVIFSRKDNHYILTDVIGKVEHVRPMRQVVANGAEVNVREITIKLHGESFINLTIWGQLNELLNATDLASLAHPVIVAVTGVSVTMYQGKPTLNTSTCSHVYINPEIAEAEALRSRFESDSAAVFDIVPSEAVTTDAARGNRNRSTLAKIEAMEWTPDFKDETYTVRATIKSINAASGWSYSACGTCNTKVSYDGGILYCKKCNQAITNAAYRYKVVANVYDETAECEFTMFDRQIYRLIKLPAAQLLTQQMGNAHEIPQQIQNLCTRSFIFEIKITNRDLMFGWNNYTVSRIFDDINSVSSCSASSPTTSEPTMKLQPQKKEKKRRYISISNGDESEDDVF